MILNLKQMFTVAVFALFSVNAYAEEGLSTHFV